MSSIETKKGISLPINLIVILSVSIIVLLAVVAFFTGVWRTDEIEEETLRQACCGQFVTELRGCEPGTDAYNAGDWNELGLEVGGESCGEHFAHMDEETPQEICC